MTTLPARIKDASPTRQKPVRSPAHRRWVREHGCCVPGCNGRPIEFAHVRSGTDGGMGMKPSDKWGISLCTPHHLEQHNIGERPFEARHKIDMKALAEEFARRSPHRGKLV